MATVRRVPVAPISVSPSDSGTTGPNPPIPQPPSPRPPSPRPPSPQPPSPQPPNPPPPSDPDPNPTPGPLPIPIPIATRDPLILALENDGRRSACNTYSLALMCMLAYRPMGEIRSFFETLTDGVFPRGHLALEGSAYALLARRVLSGTGYDLTRFRFFDSPRTHTQAFFISCGEYGMLIFRGTELPDGYDLNFDIVGVRYQYPYSDNNTRTSESAIATLRQEYDNLLLMAKNDPLSFAYDAVGNNNVSPNILSRSGYGVHLGFLLAFESIREQIEISVGDYLSGEIRTVFIAGHSLGGALAVHAATYFQHSFGSRVRVRLYTFGQPRVGDDMWSSTYHGHFQYIRVRNNRDIVPTIPISTWLGDPANPSPYYAHFGKLIRYVGNAEELRVRSSGQRVEPYDLDYRLQSMRNHDPLSRWTPAMMNRETDENPSGGALDIFSHFITSYMERILAETISACEQWYWERASTRPLVPFLNTPRTNGQGERTNFITDSHAAMFLVHNNRSAR